MDEVRHYYDLIKTGFEKLAPFYDLITLPIFGLRKQVANLIPLNKSLRILDIATGTGAQALAFGKRGFNVVGADLSEAMLTVARNKNRFKNVKFEVADATSLPYPNHSFDVSCISFALHDMLLSIRIQALKEMVRVTKPGGTLLIIDYALPKNKLGRFLVYFLVSRYETSYYPEFINSDLQALLKNVGIEVDENISVLMGAARIQKGTSQV